MPRSSPVTFAKSSGRPWAPCPAANPFGHDSGVVRSGIIGGDVAIPLQHHAAYAVLLATQHVDRGPIRHGLSVRATRVSYVRIRLTFQHARGMAHGALPERVGPVRIFLDPGARDKNREVRARVH